MIDGQPVLPRTPDEPGAFDVQLNAYRGWIGWYQEPRIAAPAVHTSGWRKTAVFNDIHAPFEHEQALLWSIAEAQAAGCTKAIVAGDAADMFSWSRWAKLKRESTPLKDFRSTQRVLNLLAESFPEVEVMEGNHCTRQLKFFAELLPPEVLEYLEITAVSALYPLRAMIQDLPNVRMIEPKKSGYATYEFLYEVGDCVISHAEIYSKIPNKAVSNLVQWLKSYAVVQGIIRPDFKVAMQAHTHQAGKTFDNFGITSYELGCLCHTQAYQGSPKLGGVRPPVRGWTLLVQDENGRTEINETNFFRFPEAVEPVMSFEAV